MELVDLATQPAAIRDQAATLLHESVNNAVGWPSLEGAHTEVAQILQEGVAIALLEEDPLLGWVGGLLEEAAGQWWNATLDNRNGDEPCY